MRGFLFFLAVSVLSGLCTVWTPQKKVVIIQIKGQINNAMVAYVKRSTDSAKDQDADLVLFEIDTPGGAVLPVLAICSIIMELDIPTASFIKPLEIPRYYGGEYYAGTAWSGGAFVAMSTKRIYMYPNTTIGAAAPVIGMQPAGEKYVSALREKFAAIAENNGYPRNLAIAMVDANHEDIYEIKIDNKKMFLTRREIYEYRKREGKKIKVPRYPVIPKGKLLTISARQASQRYEIAKIAHARGDIYKDLGLGDPLEKEEKKTWAIKLVEIVTSPTVSFILGTLVISAVWATIKGGFGTPTILGLLALLLLTYGHYLAGLADLPEIALFVIGFGLLFAEIFLLPGFGICGILGILFTLAGFLLCMQRFTIPDIHSPWEIEEMLSALVRALGGLIAGSLLFFTLVRHLRGTPLFGKLVLATELESSKGYVVDQKEVRSLVGAHAIAITPLRPSGKVEIQGRTLDVVAEGEFIEKGEPVEIKYVEGSRVVVDKVKLEEI